MNRHAAKSYLYEGIVIVMSILVAFALDASWANYQEAKVERRVLFELRDEFGLAKSRIEQSIIELETAIGASLELAVFLGAKTDTLSPDVAVDIVNRILVLNTLEIPSSVLDSIITSGQVRLISDVALRKALVKWPTLVFDVTENHEWHRVDTDEYLIPYLARYLSIRDAMIAYGAIRLTPGTFDYDLVSLQRDPTFEGRLLWRVWRQQATLSESNVLLAEAEELLRLITAEIEHSR